MTDRSTSSRFPTIDFTRPARGRMFPHPKNLQLSIASPPDRVAGGEAVLLQVTPSVPATARNSTVTGVGGGKV